MPLLTLRYQILNHITTWSIIQAILHYLVHDIILDMVIASLHMSPILIIGDYRSVHYFDPLDLNLDLNLL